MVVSLRHHDLEDRQGLAAHVDSREDLRGDVNRCILDQNHRELIGVKSLLVRLKPFSSRSVKVRQKLELSVEQIDQTNATAIGFDRSDISLRRDRHERCLRIISGVGIQIDKDFSDVVGPLVSNDRESLTGRVETRKPLLWESAEAPVLQSPLRSEAALSSSTE